jgi:proteasome lid subunit RPN8/RPN11
MSADIEFGELNSLPLESSLRPDENHFFTVVPTGEPNANDLRIYVDIDVMREMESHALSNTNVELGGVLMGRQLVDREGRTFVVVEDNIRAQHYQATKGSFKFTHETWRQITRDRDRMPKSMKMVGWYHTHPGWGVFLSGMDDFICKNFFNQPLDLALVIDPCQNDRGWFQWTTDGASHRCESVFLTAHRHREPELNEYVALLNEGKNMTLGMRTSRQQTTTSGTTVQIIERESKFDWVLPVMLGLQMIAMLVIAWQMTVTSGNGKSVVGKNENQILERFERLEIRNSVLAETLRAAVADPEAVMKSAEAMAELRLAKEHDAAAISSHVTRIRLLEQSLAENEDLQNKANKELTHLRQRVAELDSRVLAASGEMPWYQQYGLWLLLAGAGMGVVSVCGSMFWVWRRAAAEDDMPDDSEPTKPIRPL